METWPDSLQQLMNVDSFQLTLGDTTIRSDNDVGPAKVRSRYTDAVDTYTLSIYADSTDVGTLMQFYKINLDNGVNQFLFDDPFTGDPTAYRFTAPPQITPLGGIEFSIGMTWERMPSAST